MQIRFALTVFSSKRDIYGNCYHFAALRSMRTGRSYAWHTHSDGNAQHELRKALGVDWLDWDALHYVTQTVGQRELARLAKQHDASYNDPTPETIKSLEE